MNVNVDGPSVIIQNNFRSSFRLDDNESFTNDTWINLFKRAQENHIPFLCIARTIVSAGKDQLTGKHYEGVHFVKHLKINKELASLDPLSKKPILRVNIFFIACFNLDKKNNITPRNFETDIIQSQEKILNSSELLEIAVDALNIDAAENEENHEQIGKSQYILGNTVKDEDLLNGSRWFVASSKFGCTAADEELEVVESPLSTVRRLVFEEIEHEETDIEITPMELDPIDEELDAKTKDLEKVESKKEGASRRKMLPIGAGYKKT
ncbi:MAG: hypothetical protein H0W88_02095 [Parachlamydiaceae bacterium]|nr:hypothetical protein [Parachlamydiaceae bacterium]